ncbi:MAG TPA: FliM/FliN family flagellar motor switch protein [Pyrinomonadaceae bacterium]|nr:FliM/FliN family flagellar motor switch protein [Pyrinomonadaceae bacterium]
MKAASKESRVDPFAVDMFAPEHNSRSAPATPSQTDRETLRVNRSWNLRLPRVTPDQLEASAALTQLRPETYSQIHDSIVEVLSRYSLTAAEQISLSLVDLQEKDFTLEALIPDDRSAVFAALSLGSESATIAIELKASFAAQLVDRMLGGSGAAPEQLRPLTTTERAVIEFLYLSAASELNAKSGDPLVHLQSVGDQSSWWTSRVSSGSVRSDWKRGLLVSLRIGVGEITGIARVYLNRESLAALDDAVRRFQAARELTNALPRYSRIAPEVSLAVFIGKTDVTPLELSELECGDVMFVEGPVVRWREQQFSGSLLLRVGDGDESWIISELSEAGDSLRVRVNAVTAEPPARFAERLKMEEETEVVEAPGEGASLIDAVMVSVRIELAARRLQLDELSRLRKNQIIDLGCNATDPVDLVVEGRRIASGELVDIEGRLGVRITKVLS